VYDLHVWIVRAKQPLLSAHLVVQDIARWETVMEASPTLLAGQFDIHQATLQPEPMTRTVRWRESLWHKNEHELDHD